MRCGKRSGIWTCRKKYVSDVQVVRVSRSESGWRREGTGSRSQEQLSPYVIRGVWDAAAKFFYHFCLSLFPFSLICNADINWIVFRDKTKVRRLEKIKYWCNLRWQAGAHIWYNIFFIISLKIRNKLYLRQLQKKIHIIHLFLYMERIFEGNSL